MLPSPVTFPRGRTFQRRNVLAPRRRILETLLTRARVTNLALFLLATFAAFSFLLNLAFYFSTDSSRGPDSILATIDENARHLNHLVIVPGHAIWKGTNADLRLEEDQWILEAYQKGKGRIAAFFKHIALAYDHNRP